MTHFESDGQIFDKNEIPICDFCGEQALWETVLSGINVCDEDDCRLQLASDCIVSDIREVD